MDLRKLLLTKNNCYKVGKTITPIGVMWHSTGANNPNLRRYVNPDDGKLGVNIYNNHWNTAKPGGREVCVHAFIGKDKNGNIATYQTLPFNMRGWHAGGSANDKYIGFEICEDSLTDKTYFDKVYKEAVEFTAYLCELYNLDPMGKNVIICHADGYKLGIASNHGDIYHWFKKHGKTMEDVRKDVKSILEKSAAKENETEAPEELYRIRKTWEDAKSQIGAYKVLDNAKAQADKFPGYYVFNSKGVAVYPVAAVTKKSVEEIAKEVIAGKWGNGTDRKNRLESAGYSYSEVQVKVNELVKGTTVTNKKTVDEIAREVIKGKWGNGAARKTALAKAGYDYKAVQKRVNELLK